MVELQPGATLNETYELLEPLGQGGMGVVWKARHLRLPKEVALKLLISLAQESPEVVTRFRREAEIASRLGHPHIVEVLDFNTLPDGRPYIVMELLKGESLRGRLARGAVPMEEALGIVAQVAAALQAAHQAGVVHRDLKPENIFLTRRPTAFGSELCAKVLDFGISKIQGTQTKLTQDHAVIGTPAYMSPEQACGRNAEVDARTDQFALATIGYELLSGHCPFSGETLAEVINKVVFQETPPLGQLRPALPEHVSKAIDRGMAKDPTQRFASVEAFLGELLGGAAPGRQAAPLERQAQALAETLSPVAQTLPPLAVAETSGSSLGLQATLAPAEASRPVTLQPGAVAESGAAAGTAAPRSAAVRIWLVGAALTALLAGGAFWLGRSGPREPVSNPPPAPKTGEPKATVNPPQRQGSAPGPASKPSASTTAPLARAPGSPTRSPGSTAAVKKPSRPTAKKLPAKRPGELAASGEASLEAELREASMALRARDYDRVLRLASHSLYQRQSTAALALLAAAHCGKRSLGEARPYLDRLRAMGGGLHRRMAVVYCRRAGYDVR